MKRPSFTSIYILFSISVFLLGAFSLQRWDRALAYLLSNKEEGDIVFQSLPQSRVSRITVKPQPDRRKTRLRSRLGFEISHKLVNAGIHR